MDPIGASKSWQWHGYSTSWTEVNGERVQSVSGGSHWAVAFRHFIGPFERNFGSVGWHAPVAPKTPQAYPTLPRLDGTACHGPAAMAA